jgi:hypothetical protein
MGEFFTKAAELWAKSRIVAWTLVILATALALWTALVPQPPGISIGLLALVAGVMSLRPDMHILEKIAWIVLLICFTVLEVHAIGESDRKNEQARGAQNAAFDAIVTKLTDSDKLSRQQFQATMDEVGKVFDKTKQAADTATAAIDAITGGNTYCYLKLTGVRVPQWFVKGSHPLHDVYVTIRDMHEVQNVMKKTLIEGNRMPTDEELTMARVPIKIGDLSPNHNEAVSPLPQILQSAKERNLALDFYAINGEWTEVICMKRSTTPPSPFNLPLAESIHIERKGKTIWSETDPNYPKDQPCN